MSMIGALGWRLLDGVRFACVVKHVEIQTDASVVLTVQYLDDNVLEDGVEIDEFLASQPQSETKTQSTAVSIASSLLHLMDPLESDGCLWLCLIATYLDRLSWVKTLTVVSKAWRHALLAPQHWKTLRIRDIPSCRPIHSLQMLLRVSFPVTKSSWVVGETVQELVLDDSDVTDDQVLALVHQCTRLHHLSLERCPHISFLVLYELLRHAREQQKAGQQPRLTSANVWLCPGISPAFTDQLLASQVKASGASSPVLKIIDPGFFMWESTLDTLYRVEVSDLNYHVSWEPGALSIVWLNKDALCVALDQEDHLNDPFHDFHELQRHRVHIRAFPLTIVPLVRLDLLFHAPKRTQNWIQVGFPTSVDSLTRLIDTYEDPGDSNQLQTTIQAHRMPDIQPTSQPKPAVEPDDSLEARAAIVFASLRQTTEQLQQQVQHLEEQVARMTSAKQEAEREYKQAQVTLDRVAKEADRALFTLATSSNDAPVHPIPPPPRNGIITSMPDDVLLPSLPSSERIKDLGKRLETHNYAILDGFLGEDLSFDLRRDVEALYRASRAHEDDDLPSPPQKEDTLSPPAPTTALDTARFRLGELAGGKTGRNLRYQMAHVRGDYVLWLDEQDVWCPSSVRLVLRQLDRLILERLSQMNHELLMSALLRKKAMVTCYPGENRARYTRHCDNPNSNGRKLTAILYLNPDYESSQGGQLRLELDGDNGAVDIEPRMDRLVLFYSDRRVPHQVLSCHSCDRFALTLWYLDYDEFFNAQVFGASGQDKTQEHTRIEKEMKGFEAAKDAPI